MGLGERIRIILSERNLKQVRFAQELGVSANYVNQLAQGKKEHISEHLARLIEEMYGYGAEWIMTGKGEKNTIPPVSAVKADMIKKISKMPDEDVIALMAFAKTLNSVKRAFQK